MLHKLQLTIARIESGQAATATGFASADELIANLQILEDALTEGAGGDLARDLVRPVRWAVEIFRFRTVRLDLRENSTRLTETLQALWRASTGDRRDTARSRVIRVEKLDHGRTYPAVSGKSQAAATAAGGA